MNNKRKFPAYTMLFALFMIIPLSCSKDDSEGISESDLMLAQDDAYTYALFEEVDHMVMDEITTLDANAYSTLSLKSTTDEDPCYTVDVDFPDSTRFPKVVTIDFGDGCTTVFRNDTIIRKGIIQITVTDRWLMEGAQHIVNFIDFSINDVALKGTKTITNKGFNEAGNLEIGFKLENGAVVFPDSDTFKLAAEYLKEWIRYRTPLSDTLIVTGNAMGTNVLGEDFSRVITEPLVMVHCREYNLRWVIVDGKVEMTNSATGVTTIDYSAEGCDGTVIINKNGYRHNYWFKYIHRQHHR